MVARVALLGFLTFAIARAIHTIWTVEESEREWWHVFGSSVTRGKRIFVTVVASVVFLVLWVAVLLSE